jgi:hypothetical protein
MIFMFFFQEISEEKTSTSPLHPLPLKYKYEHKGFVGVLLIDWTIH